MSKLRFAAFLLPLTLCAADFTGSWASAPIYLILKQDGTKLSGSGGPTAKDQQLFFENGTVDGDRASFTIGSFQVAVQLKDDELRGELNMGNGTQAIFLKRVTANATPGPRTFEVASVKHAETQGQSYSSSMKLDPGRVTMTNVSLTKMLIEAYQVKAYQISGPDWLASELYNVTASMAAGATRDEVLIMMQNLLADRFKVTLHREMKEMTVYALVLDKGGHKMKESQFGKSSTSLSNGTLGADAVPMRNVAVVLSRLMDRPVLDMTDLKGFYSFNLTFTPDEAPAAPGTGVVAESPVGPSLERAVREQLGLRLEGRRAPVEMLVIDRAEKMPTEN
ncbi:MAG: TIGR03435 family protein [Candidatus Solibacter sp.]